MSYRSLSSFAFWITVVLVASVIACTEGANYDLRNASHLIIQGTSNHNNKIFLLEHIKRPGKFLRVVSEDVIYPPHNSSIIITYFILEDLYLDGYGGYAFHTSGGVGYKSVGFHLRSKRNHGFEFTLKLYGATTEEIG